MAKQIDLQPEVLDLLLYAGDGVSLKLICTNGSNAPVDITGGVSAQIRLTRLTEDPPIAVFTTDLVDGYLGIIRLSLTGEQTMDLLEDPSSQAGKFVGVWDVQWTPASLQPRTLLQGKVECTLDVTR